MKLTPPSTALLSNLCHHRRPTIDVGNGDGFIEVAEVSNEHLGGDWSDIGYFFNDDDARAFAALPKVLEALALCLVELDHLSGPWADDVRAKTKAALLEAGYTITEP